MITCGGMIVCLAAAVFYALITPIENRKDMQAKYDVGALQKVLALFKKDEGRYPTQEESLTILLKSPQGKHYVVSSHALRDPWQRSFVYQAPGANATTPPLIYSVGPNGVDEHGAGDDITQTTQLK